MPFRDRTPICPGCRVDLARADDDREAWRCPRCAGTALGVGDLIDDLLEVAPHLRPADGVRELVTVSRRAGAELACPVCGKPMEPVYLAAVETERCREDNLVWLDRGEREAIIARAEAQPRSGPLEHLRAILVGPPMQPAARVWTKRATTIVSLLAVVAAIPLGLFGALFVSMGNASKGGGAAGGLGALVTLGGWSAIVIAAIMFVVGGIAFVRAAR